MYVLRLRNRAVVNSGSRNAAIPIEAARVCSVCWTVHQADECPECKARQWRNLLELLEVLGLETWMSSDAPSGNRGEVVDLAAS